MNNNTLIVFGRLPLHHISAKTRLGKEIGDMKKAKKIGHDLTKATLQKFATLSVKKIFYYGGSTQNKKELSFLQKKFSKYTFIPQPNGKDVRGMKEAFEETTGEKKILMGTDIIGLNEEVIENCFEILNHSDVVIVPLEDKGYGLVGMSKEVDIFSDIQNFDSRTPGYDLIKETQLLCDKKDISLFIYPDKCFDIDTLKDYERMKAL